MPKIRAQEWYNGDPPRDLSGFLSDRTNRFLGWPVMRQIRVINDSGCPIANDFQSIIDRCVGDFHISNEDRRSFEPGWTSIRTNLSVSSSIRNAFIYRTEDQIDSFRFQSDRNIYPSGGYVYEFRGRFNELRGNLTLLHRYSWIDRFTRAVFLQFSLYNPNAQMFTSVICLVEFLASGAVIVQIRVDPFTFNLHTKGFSSLFHLIVSIIYLILILYLTFSQIPLIVNERWLYFRKIWTYFDWIIIGCSWMQLVGAVWRYQSISHLAELFHKTNGYQYLNLHPITSAFNLITALSAISCYFATIKLLRFARLNRRLSLFNRTLRHASTKLLGFTLMFSILVFAFIALFYLLFSTEVESCATLLSTTYTLFDMFLLKFDTADFKSADPLLGPLVFASFIFILVFIGCTMFISLILDGLHLALKESNATENHDEELLTLFFEKVKRWIRK